MRIDSHQHFWKYSAAEYPWINPTAPIRRDFMPEDLKPELDRQRIDGCVAVQARETVEESRWLLELSDRHEFIKGVVGWVDLRSDRVEEQLAPLVRNKKFVGVRHVVQEEPDDNFVLGGNFQRGIGRLKQFGLKYDLLIYPKQLPAAIRLAENFPEQPFVLDHIAKPPIKAGEIEPWKERIRQLAKLENVYCKVSGMVTEADWERWTPANFKPYLDVVAEAFGTKRLMYGSDWPVALLAGTYERVYRLAHDYFAPQGQAVLDQVFGNTATQFYGLNVQ